jgi:hypothetical protein
MSDAPSQLPADPKPKSLRPVFFVAGFVCIQVFFLLFTFYLASSPWFQTHDAYPGLLQIGYSLRLKHADCDIVLYGDSSALTGLDPEVIQQITGLKACNLSEGILIQDVVGSRLPLDVYLRNNKRPRYLLAMYTPSKLQPYIDKFDRFEPEGVFYLLQFARDPTMIRQLLRTRDWALNYVFWAGRQIVADFSNRYLLGNSSTPSVDARTQRDSRYGYWPFPLPAETKCVRTAFHLHPADIRSYPDSVAEMRKIYNVQGTTVIINMAPVPTCDTLQQTYREKSEGLRDNAFETLPISDFNEGDVHFSPEGGRHISVQAANQILALEDQRRPQQPLTNDAAGHTQ